MKQRPIEPPRRDNGETRMWIFNVCALLVYLLCVWGGCPRRQSACDTYQQCKPHTLNFPPIRIQTDPGTNHLGNVTIMFRTAERIVRVYIMTCSFPVRLLTDFSRKICFNTNTLHSIYIFSHILPNYRATSWPEKKAPIFVLLINFHPLKLFVYND